MIDFEALFEKHEAEHLKFDRVENRRSTRPDLHAFLLLAELCPDTRDIIRSAEHDQIWLSPDPDTLADIMSQAQVIELARCGVFWDVDSLSMYV